MKLFIDTANIEEMLMQMINHPLTDAGIERFKEDWKKTGLRI